MDRPVPDEAVQAARDAWTAATGDGNWFYDVDEALTAVAEAVYRLGLEAGRGDLEHLEREARADEIEAWAAATLTRANQIRRGDDHD